MVTDWLRQEDAAGIIQAADGFNAEFGLLLRFLLFTGLRIGEVLAIRWSDIDLESGTVWVTREKDGVASDVRLRDDLRAPNGTAWTAGASSAHLSLSPRWRPPAQTNPCQARLSRPPVPNLSDNRLDTAAE